MNLKTKENIFIVSMFVTAIPLVILAANGQSVLFVYPAAVALTAAGVVIINRS